MKVATENVQDGISAYCATETRRRIALGEQAFMNKKKLTGSLSIELKKRRVKSVLLSVVLYASETWSMTQADRKRLEAMEMWIWRRMEKISGVDKISNKEVLQRVTETKTMLDTVIKRKRVVRAFAKK